ncbi:MAG: glycerophosphodiester phosphodiesterase family protein [Amphiplicatus sp.]
MRALWAALLLAACAPAERIDAPAAPSGWTIAPEGDLNRFFDCLAAEKITLVSAHRGGPAPGYPENAIATFEATLARAPAILEIDVAQSADGVLFLLHDETLDRTTTGTGAAAGLAYAEIKKLRLKDPEGRVAGAAPPRLDDVLAWAAGRTLLQLDIKRSARYEDVAAAVKAARAEARVILVATSVGQAKKLHRLLPAAMISLNMSAQSDLNRAVAAGAPADRLLAFTGTKEAEPRLFDALAGRDVEIVFGTLGPGESIDAAIAASGDDSQYADIAAMGVDIIATDRPAEAGAALAEAGRGARDGVCGVRAPAGARPRH